MTAHSYFLAILLLLMPIVAIFDGLAMAPLAFLLFLLLAWPHRRALADWRAFYRCHFNGIVIVALLTIWPVLTSLWSILPQDSFITSLRSAALLLPALLGVFFAGRRNVKDDTELWLLPALGISLSALLITLGKMPDGGPLPWMAALSRHDELTYLTKDINRGLCVLSVLIWPAVIALLYGNHRKLALILPWALMPALFSLHSLSAKTGLCAGLITMYGMMLWPVAFKRLLILGVPMLFIAWPLLFHLYEPLLRASIFNELPPSSQHRVEIWHFVLSKWQERPWLGWGTDSSRAIPGGLKEIHPGQVLLPLHPHNLSLHVLLEQGIIGFCLFAMALWLFACRILQADPARPRMVTAARAATLVAYLTIGMSGFGMWQGWWEATGLAAFLIALFAEPKPSLQIPAF